MMVNYLWMWLEHVVTFAQEEIVLTKKRNFQLIALLIHIGKIVTQKQIMTELWGISHEEDTHYLRILVKKTPPKLEILGPPKYIFTGVGLRFQGQSKLKIKRVCKTLFYTNK